MSEEGEIRARLTLDGSDYLRGIEEAKAEAESLKTVDPRIVVRADTATAVAGLDAVKARLETFKAENPKIKVGADVTGAIAKLQAVTAAEAALTRATDEQTRARMAADSAGRAAVLAQQRLDDVMTRRGRTDLQVSQAEASLANATERADYTVQRVTKSAEQLKSARDDLASATKAAGTAESDFDRALKSAANSTGNAGNAARGAIPWMGILAGAIGAVSPGIVAVGAAAVGLSASLTGMGVAGVLAIKGIQAEMAAGTTLGNAYSDMFAGLTNDLSLLEHTAAVGIFTGLSAGVKTLETDIGPLNQDVALLSGQLGGMLATTATVAVHALGGFTPVLVAGGQALQGFLQGVDSFTTSNGFTAFVQYTVARLPDVMHLLSATLGAVGGLFTALAPAGQSTLFLLSSLMDLIRALAPTIGALMPVVEALSGAIGGIALVTAAVLNAIGPLGPVLVGTTAAFIGLTFANKALAPALLAAADAEGVAAVATRALGVAIDFAMGPLGLALIAVSLFAGAMATMSTSTVPATRGLSAYSAAIRGSTVNVQTAIADAARLQVAHAGLGAAMTAAGVTQQQLTAAISTGGAAYTNLRASLTGETQELKNNNQASLLNKTAKQQVVQFLDQERAGVIQAIAAYNKYATSVGASTVKNYAELTAHKQLAASLGMTNQALTVAEGNARKAAAAALVLRQGYVYAGDAADLLKLDMDKLNGASISNAEAQAAWASGLDSLKSSFNATSKAITGNSNAALENRGAVASLAATGETALQSIAGMSHSATQTTAAYRSMRAELINQVVAMGNSRAAATKLIDEYFRVPKTIKTDFTGNDADAKAKAAAAKAAALDFARGDYKAALKADNSPANRAKAQAVAEAEQFAHGQYEAKYAANPSNANRAAMEAAAKGHWFGNGYYMAYLRANPNPAMNAIYAVRHQLQNLSGTTATVYIQAIQTGSTASRAAQIARNAGFADGGTIGMAAGGMPGMFSGTVSGPGTSWNDQAMRVNLADREFVMSNKFGQADWSRPFLEAINSQRVKTPGQLGQMFGGGGPQQVTNNTRNMQPIININYPVAQDPVTAAREASQYIQAYTAII